MSAYSDSDSIGVIARGGIDAYPDAHHSRLVDNLKATSRVQMSAFSKYLEAEFEQIVARIALALTNMRADLLANALRCAVDAERASETHLDADWFAAAQRGVDEAIATLKRRWRVAQREIARYADELREVRFDAEVS